MNRPARTLLTLCALLASTALFADEDSAVTLADLQLRLKRVEAVQQIERLQSVYGYYQDRYLFDQIPALFSSREAEAHFDGGIWSGTDGIRRLWLEYFVNTLGQGRVGPIAGELYDQPQMQGVIDVADDALSATAQFRTLGRRVTYGKSEEWVAGLYNNDYVFEDGVWKLQTFRYCTRWIAPYHEGWIDSRPVQTPRWETVSTASGGPDTVEDAGWQCEGSYPAAGADNAMTSFDRSRVEQDRTANANADGAVAEADLSDLSRRAERVADALDVERLHSAYGYQQDKSLFSEQVDLFTDADPYAVFQNGRYEGKAGLRRLWYGHWSRLTEDTLMPIDGFLNEHFFAQPVVTIAEDGQSARARFRSRDYVFTYVGEFPLPAGHKTAAEQQDAFHADGEARGAGALNLIQDLIYENAYVKEGGIWKLQGLVICIYANSTYGRGYADIPVPGEMGNGMDVQPGDRADLDLSDDMPEQSNELFPDNSIGPNHVVPPSELGCYIGKSQVMSRSAVFPFHYEHPVTGDSVTWRNRRDR